MKLFEIFFFNSFLNLIIFTNFDLLGIWLKMNIEAFQVSRRYKGKISNSAMCKRTYRQLRKIGFFLKIAKTE